MDRRRRRSIPARTARVLLSLLPWAFLLLSVWMSELTSTLTQTAEKTAIIRIKAFQAFPAFLHSELPRGFGGKFLAQSRRGLFVVDGHGLEADLEEILVQLQEIPKEVLSIKRTEYCGRLLGLQ
mmetsp:Transcript_19409/g.54081  ORF Transcript_19409/g.54081 Transcript_19409/m.54081 type:complete len:124 (-) Transcript_19409:260-631(-)